MPNYSGYPTVQDVHQWQIDEQKKNASYEYIMPRDAQKVQTDFKKLAIVECIKTCAYANAKLDEKEIAIKAQVACERAKNQTKAVSFTNYEEDFKKVAQSTYTEFYSVAQELFSRKYHLLRDTKHDLEQYGEDSALQRIAVELEQVIRHRRK